MNADDIFDAAVAIAREVVDERSLGALLNKALERSQFLLTPWRQRKPVEWSQLNQAASELVAPYLQRIAKLEADVRHLSESNASYVDGAIRLTTKLMASEARIANLETRVQDTDDVCKRMAEELGTCEIERDCARQVAYEAKNATDKALDRLAKLEAENKSLRDAARAIIAVHNELPTWPSSKQCAKAIDDLTNPVCAMIALLEGAL